MVSKLKGTTFRGFVSPLPDDVFILPSKVSDDNPHFGKVEVKYDWLQFECAKSKFVARSIKNVGTELSISTPYLTPLWIANLPLHFLTALGLRVGKKLSWICLNCRASNTDELTVFSKFRPSTISGILPRMVLKPGTNVPLLADTVQFLFDFPESPIGALQYAIWDADCQTGFTLRELAVAVAIEGISDYIVKTFSTDLNTPVSIKVGKVKSKLNRTRDIFKRRMAAQTDLLAEPYYSFIVRAVKEAKPYTTPDRIMKAIQILAPSDLLSKKDIESWRKTRNSAAHAKNSSTISETKFDDYVVCVNLWHRMLRELILCNPKTLSKVLRMVFKPTFSEIAEGAYFRWKRTGISDEKLNWCEAETTLIHEKIQANKRTLEEHYESDLFPTPESIQHSE